MISMKMRWQKVFNLHPKYLFNDQDIMVIYFVI
jgi:hypothetical protein